MAEATYLTLEGNFDEALEKLQRAQEQASKLSKVNFELAIRLEIYRVRSKAGRLEGLDADVKALTRKHPGEDLG